MNIRFIKSLTVILIILVTFSSNVVGAKPNYITAKPLTEVVSEKVADVRSGKIVLPIITWGGDIATILGNGNNKKTQNGSIFAKEGLDVILQREDVFTKQLSRYLRGETPYIRGTLGMINSATDLLNKDAKTKPIVIYQHTWSSGGDALTVKEGINKAKDLKDKTIALQAYGPHVDYLAKILSDAGLSLSDVDIKWLPDLTGTNNSPMAAMYESDIDAAFVILPDALALTSGGNTGTGSEDSVKGAKILLSTKTANRVIADVYAVRADYFESNKSEVAKLVNALLKSEEALSNVFKKKSSDSATYQRVMRASADILLDSPEAASDAEGLYLDAEYVRFNGNTDFFNKPNNPRSFERLNKEIQRSLSSIGLISGKQKLTDADWNWNDLKKGLVKTQIKKKQRFNQKALASAVAKKQQQNSLDDSALFSFEVFFNPNQKEFTADLYQDSFEKVIDLAATYGGAVITVEGHSDPLGYLRKLKAGETSLVLGRIKQSAKNLSISRASAVRDSIVSFAKIKGVTIDTSQFAVVGHGIAKPSTGICSNQPCVPKNEKEWRSNMRVEFRIIQIEAEADVFKPL